SGGLCANDYGARRYGVASGPVSRVRDGASNTQITRGVHLREREYLLQVRGVDDGKASGSVEHVVNRQRATRDSGLDAGSGAINRGCVINQELQCVLVRLISIGFGHSGPVRG